MYKLKPETPTRVLLVEDNLADIEIVRRLLKKDSHSFQLDVSQTGNEGLKKFSKRHYHCAIIDHHLPDTNGLELIQKIFKKEPRLPILMVTGNPSETLSLGARKLGVVDYIKKEDLSGPLLVKKLLEARALMERQDLRLKTKDLRTHAPTHSRTSQSPISLLLFEDSRFQAEVYFDWLKKSKSAWAIDWAPTVEAGLQKLKEKKYDCVLADLSLPDSQGLNHLKELHAQYPNTPFIVVTGTYEDRPTVRKSFKMGAYDFLFKEEATQDSLVRTILEAVQSKQEEVKREKEKEREILRRILRGESDIQETPFFREKAETIYKVLVESMSEGIIAFERDGVITFVNTWMSRLLGIQGPNELIGKQIESLMGPENIRELREKLVVAPPPVAPPEADKDRWPLGSATGGGVGPSKKETQTFETQISHQSGFLVPIRISQTPLAGRGGKIQSYFWVVADLTKQKEQEILVKEQMWALENANKELQQIDKVKSDFLSMVSHELRTPLASIKEGVSLVLDKTAGDLNPNQAKFLEVAKRNIDRLANLINDLLDLSKMEAGQLTLVKGFINVNELAEEAKLTFDSLALKKNMNILLELAQNLPLVESDRDKISEVFTNLVSNAIKYSNEGAKITLRTCRYKEDCNFVLASVEDTGIGISKENLPRLFTKFQQLEETITRKVGGSGLGLAICKQIIDLHGGRIWVESEEGKGSQFYFTLPMEGGRVMKRRKVLVIDDEADLCTTIKARLEAANLDIATALSGKEGLEKIKDFKPDLILLDLMMPEMDGFQVCKALRKNKETSEVPIVVLTCLEDEDSAKKALALGASGYMVKPFEKDSLLFTIREFLK